MPGGRARAALLASLGVAVACGGTDSPEERVRTALAEMERAVEARDLGAARAHVSETYADARGNDKRAVQSLVTAAVLRNPSIHLLSRIARLEVREVGENRIARVRVFVAMASTPLPAVGDLARIRADLYRFDLELADEGDAWRVVGADWAPASATDFRSPAPSPTPAERG